MPYRKNKSGKKPAVKKLATKVNKIAKAMKGVLTHSDEVTAGQSMHTTGNVLQLSAIGQGVGEGQRHGNTCTLKRFRISGQIVSNPTTTNNQTVRFVVAMRKSNPELQTPSITDVFSDTARPYSPLSPYVFGDYKILYDKLLTIRAQSSGTAEKYSFRKTIDMKEVKQEYQNNTSATCENNSLWLFAIGDSALAGNPATIYMYNRIEFYP